MSFEAIFGIARDKSRIDHHFAGTSENADKAGYALTQELLAGKLEELRRGIV